VLFNCAPTDHLRARRGAGAGEGTQKFFGEVFARAGVEAEELDDFKGLNARHPWLAAIMAMVMLSMAGLPPFVGFYAKLTVLQALVGAGWIWLAVVAVTSAPFVTSSWSIREASNTANGMPAVYLVKSLLWVFCAVLFVQGLALIARRALLLAGHPMRDHDEDPVTDERA